MIDLRQIEAQPILMDRIGRFGAKHGLSLADAIERLIRTGLFLEAVPDGSILVRRNGRVEWSGPEDDPRKPWRRGEPDADADVLF